MEHCAFAIFCSGQKTFELHLLADRGFGQRFRCGAKRDGSQTQFHFPALSSFDLIRLVFELEI